MTSQPSLFDPDLSRGRRNPQSQAAHARLLPFKPSMRQRCYDYIESQGSYGATLKELCDILGKLPHQLSGRVTELVASEKVRRTKSERLEHAVYVTAVYGEK
jgi:hypothetical protein